MNEDSAPGAGGRFRGLSVAAVTPFDADGRVDRAALAAHVSWMVDEGVDVVMPCGTTGEGATLTPNEHRAVVATCLEAVGDRAPVVPGAGSSSTAVAAELVRASREEGAHGVLCVTPPYNRPSQAGLVRHFSELVEAGGGLPLVLYNVPGRTGVNLRAESVLALAELESVTGVKEASGDLEQVMEIIRARPDGFVVLAGDDVLTLPLAALGADGVVSVAANEAPGAMAALVHAALAGKPDEARTVHYRLLPLFRANFVETNPVPVKAALAMMGRMEVRYRLPLVPLREESESALRAALAESGVLEEAGTGGTA
jgi:4-hydroxy-tetrahydrodipicolinate synthase